jgi:hypothetical protein
MKHEFIPYEQALALKELGFNEPCFGLWNLNNGKHEVDIIGVCKYSKDFKYREVLAPTWQQAFRWFREKYGLHPHFCFFTDEKLWNIDIYAYLEEYGLKTDPCTMKFKAYEEAELACLKKLIEIVKDKP